MFLMVLFTLTRGIYVPYGNVYINQMHLCSITNTLSVPYANCIRLDSILLDDTGLFYSQSVWC